MLFLQDRRVLLGRAPLAFDVDHYMVMGCLSSSFVMVICGSGCTCVVVRLMLCYAMLNNVDNVDVEVEMDEFVSKRLVNKLRHLTMTGKKLSSSGR